MRLTCPNCDAQYEVPDDVIPPEGRDVQCSSCGNTWFQAPADDSVSAAPQVTAEPEWVPADTAEDAPSEPTLEESPIPETEPEPNFEEEPVHVESAIDEAIEEPFDAPIEDAPAEDAPVRQGRIISMAADATEEALTAAVREAVRRAVPASDDGTVSAKEELPELETDLNSWLDNDPQSAEPVQDDDVSDDMSEPNTSDPEVAAEETTEDLKDDHQPQRRQLDPTVTEVLREEAELETARRAEESSIETQADLGLEEPLDDAARRAQQSRERMARLRGKSIEEVDNPPAPPPLNSRRDLLPDIEEINSTLRSTEDRQPEELPDGRPTPTQRRAGGSRIGFALAILLIAGGAYVYSKPDVVSGSIPPAEPVVSAYVNAVDSGRLALDKQMTKLMLWLDGMASGKASEPPSEETSDS